MRQRGHTYDADLDLVLPDLGGGEGRGGGQRATAAVTRGDVLRHPRSSTGGGRGDGASTDRRPRGRLAPRPADRRGPRHARAAHRPGTGRAHGAQRFRTTLAGLVGDSTLAAAATTTTRRTVRHLLGEDDRVLASVADDRVDGVRLGDARRGRPADTRRLARGRGDARRRPPKLLRRVGEALTDAGAQPADGRSRLADVLDGAGRRPEAPAPRDRTQQLGPAPVGELVRELLTRDPLVREGLPEGVHTMRVAIRRLRSMLATGRPFLDRDVTDPLRDELAWLADALGEVRDSEVRRERLDSSIDALVDERAEVDWEADQVRSALWSPLVEEHDRALAALDEVLTSERYIRLLDQLLALVAAPPWTERATRRIRGKYVRRTRRELERVNQLMEAAHDTAHAPEERALALHEARRATKRARYAVEPLRAVYGDAAVTLTTRLKALQAALGEHQDTVVTRDYLHALVQGRVRRSTRRPPGGRRAHRAREPGSRGVRPASRGRLAEGRALTPARVTDRRTVGRCHSPGGWSSSTTHEPHLAPSTTWCGWPSTRWASVPPAAGSGTTAPAAARATTAGRGWKGSPATGRST